MILDELAAYAKERVEAAKARLPLSELRQRAEALPMGEHRFRRALSGAELSFICEVKKASPSKGIIDPEFPYRQIAADYEAAGADAISCLTEPKWFLGSDAIFAEIRRTVETPMLRKDFTVDAYQIYEAKVLGADAVLLICAILSEAQLREYLAICAELGLDALVETHSAAEIETALRVNAEILGVNNRNLKDFSMHLDNAVSLREQVPEDKLFVAESGIKTAEDIAALRRAGADAVLIGETLMRAPDKTAALRALKGERG